jgi:hypothetical protein
VIDSRAIYLSVERFRAEAEEILGFSEESIHRLAGLSKSYDQLDSLNFLQSDMLRQALRCIEVGIFRGAHVLAWAAIVDYCQRHAARDGFTTLNAKYEKWKLSSLDDLRDNIGEYNLIEGLFGADLITKAEKKSLHALLNKRNECAHPTDYFPDLNQSLGYVSECIDRLGKLVTKYGASDESEN